MLPDWYYHLALAARLAALIKRKVGRLQVTPVRPIGVGSAMTRLVCAASVQYFEGVVHRILYPLQVAVGVKGSRCQIWSSFWAPLVSAACRLRESDSS